MVEVIIAAKNELRDFILSSRSCISCNITKGLRISKNGFINFDINKLKSKLPNKNCKLFITVKKISGNGIIFIKIDNFTKRTNVANVQKIDLYENTESFSISRDNNSIGDISIVNIGCYINNGDNMAVVMNPKLTNRRPHIEKEVANNMKLLENIKKCNDFLYENNILLNYNLPDDKKLKLFKNIIKSYGFNINNLAKDDMHDDYWYYFISKCKYIICDDEFYVKNKRFLDKNIIFMYGTKIKGINIINNVPIEEITDKILYNKKIEQVDKNTKFKIIIPAYNVEKWIEKTLSSISIQEYKNYDVMIIDDCSTDLNQRNIIQTYCEKYNSEQNKWKYIFNKTRKNSLYNIMLGIYNSSCNDDDVIIILDGDDWLYDEKVLNKLNYNYSNNDIFLTYGQYICYPNNEMGHCREMSEDIVLSKAYRKTDWMLSHLKTFKFKLFKNIKREDFLDTNGEFMKMTGDLAIMYPVAEMAGNKNKFISDILYVYNMETPINDNKVNVGEQARLALLIRGRSIYNTIV